MRLIDADKLKQDHFMGNECETCINDVGRCQDWHSYTKMDFCGWIDDAPTMDSVKHGRWIEHHEPFTWMGYTTWTCSKCGYECGYEKEIGLRTFYCPNCGCKMDEVEDEQIN